jgi:predicted membrane-bound spermidine synthase
VCQAPTGVYRVDMDVTVMRVEAGTKYELLKRGTDWDILVNGSLAMSTRGPRLEDAIIDLALTPWGARDDVTVLLAGLGMGLLLRKVLDRPHVRHVDVVESSPTIVEWARGPLAALNGAALADSRVAVLPRDLLAHLKEPDPKTGQRPTGYSILILDTDDWPASLSRPENVDFYHDDGLVLLETALRPGGVFATHTTRRDDELEARIRGTFQSVARVGVPVEVDGANQLHFVYRGRRASASGGAG